MEKLKIKRFVSLNSEKKQLSEKVSDFIRKNDIRVIHVDSSYDILGGNEIYATASVIYFEATPITDKGTERLLKAILEYGETKETSS